MLSNVKLSYKVSRSFHLLLSGLKNETQSLRNTKLIQTTDSLQVSKHQTYQKNRGPVLFN